MNILKMLWPFKPKPAPEIPSVELDIHKKQLDALNNRLRRIQAEAEIYGQKENEENDASLGHGESN